MKTILQVLVVVLLLAGSLKADLATAIEYHNIAADYMNKAAKRYVTTEAQRQMDMKRAGMYIVRALGELSEAPEGPFKTELVHRLMSMKFHTNKWSDGSYQWRTEPDPAILSMKN